MTRQPPMTEHQHQVALFDWARLQSKAHPELAWMYAIPNGGKRNIMQGVWAKAEGLKAGVWDIHLPAPRMAQDRAYCPGMYIEFKSEKGRLTGQQRAFGEAMEAAGFYCLVSRDWYDAAGEIMRYLKNAKPNGGIKNV